LVYRSGAETDSHHVSCTQLVTNGWQLNKVINNRHSVFIKGNTPWLVTVTRTGYHMSRLINPMLYSTNQSLSHFLHTSHQGGQRNNLFPCMPALPFCSHAKGRLTGCCLVPLI
jgi:hypothetical protein